MLRNKQFPTLQVRFGLNHAGFLLLGLSFRRVVARFRGLVLFLKNIGLDLRKKIALLYMRPFFEGKFDNFARDLRRNLDHHLRLNFPRRLNDFRYGMAPYYFGLDYGWF